jgi:hypothetical protein
VYRRLQDTRQAITWWIQTFGNEDDWASAVMAVANATQRWYCNPKYTETFGEGNLYSNEISAPQVDVTRAGGTWIQLTEELADAAYNGCTSTSFGELPVRDQSAALGRVNSYCGGFNPIMAVMISSRGMTMENKMTSHLPGAMGLSNLFHRVSVAICGSMDRVFERLGMSEVALWDLNAMPPLARGFANEGLKVLDESALTLLDHINVPAWRPNFGANAIVQGIDPVYSAIFPIAGALQSVCPRRLCQTTIAKILREDLGLPVDDFWSVSSLGYQDGLVQINATIANQTVDQDLLQVWGTQISEAAEKAYRHLMGVGATWSLGIGVQKTDITGITLVVDQGAGTSSVVPCSQVFYMPGRHNGLFSGQLQTWRAIDQGDNDAEVFCYNIPCMVTIPGFKKRQIGLTQARAITASTKGKFLETNVVLSGQAGMTSLPELSAGSQLSWGQLKVSA